MFKLTKFVVQDLLRNWIVLLYMAFLMLAGFGFFMLEGQVDKALLGILNLVLLLVPMVTIIFSTIYYYNMYEFVVLLLAQPLKRKTVLGSIYLGLAISFGLALLIGLGLPLLLMHPSAVSVILLLVSLMLTLVFIALAILAGIWARDKARGMGISLLFWVYFVLIFDGIILMLMYNFSDYPIERGVLFITFLNPVDLGRILVLMQTEAAALMGYSGAIFNKFFNEWWGVAGSIAVLVIWALVPVGISFRMFRHKDL
ncbi:MAG TPA: ABC transporter permease subunit [Cyclobacteriaceae bacterium]|nr:ABC transporter permease subunit [Cyclobacteriaceae bacterium]